MPCTATAPCSEVRDRLADGRMALAAGALTLGSGFRVAGPCPFCRMPAVATLARSWDHQGLAADRAAHLERQRAAPAEVAA